MNHKIRFAVVGTNNISHKFMNAAMLDPRFELAAVYSRQSSTGNTFAERYKDKFPHIVTFTDYRQMLQSQDIHAIYVASPHSCHCQQTISALNAGKHVLCEKAFASNVKEVKAMITAAKANNVMLMEAMKSTVLPTFDAVKNNLHKIGRIHRYFATYCQFSSRYENYRNGIIENAFLPELSNGALLDIGIYALAPLVWIFGKPRSLQAHGVLMESGVDGKGSMILDYGDMEAVVIYSKVSNSHLSTEFQGEEGTLIVHHANLFDNAVIRYRNGSEEVLTVAHQPYDMYYELHEFINCIENRQTESQKNPLTNSLILMEIMDAARQQIGLVYPADSIND